MIFGIWQRVIVSVPSWFPTVLAAAEEKGAESGPPKLPSLIWILEKLTGAHLAWAEHWVNPIFAFIVTIFLAAVAMRVYVKRQMIPGPLQNFVEMLVEGMYNFIYTILGKDTKKYIPFLGTMFFYILAMNWIGMVPGGHSPSTSLNITGSMAILTFLYAQYTGISRQGILGYFDHMAGNPRDAIGWSMVILLFPLHIVGEVIKPVSLAFRLYGNITGEDTLIAVFVGLGVSIMAVFGVPHFPIGIPFQIPFYFLGLLLSTIQALVFTLLSTIYILLMLPHEEHEQEKVDYMRGSADTHVGLAGGVGAVSAAVDAYEQAKAKGELPLGVPDKSKKQHNDK